EVLIQLKRQRVQLFIEDVNKMLLEMMVQERIPEIYFRLGETIYHYMIDEFQDTSPIQWANLRPLIENSLAQGGSSLFIVGDTKQSIYSFRFADWTIMKRLMHENEFPSATHELKLLDTNWRSYGRILDFNAEVFQNIIPDTEYGTACQESGLVKSGQRVRAGYEGKGYVEVALFAEDEEDLPERSKLLEVVADCRTRGHRLRDIAILTPKNDDVVKVSGWLNAESIRFISHSSLDIRTRRITGEIITLLQFLDSPIDDLAFGSFLLSDLFQAVLQHHSVRTRQEELHALVFTSYVEKRSPLYKVFQEQHGDLWTRYFADLYGTVGYLPLYDLISEIYKVYDLFTVRSNDEGTLVKLLEVVKLFEESGNNSIKDFLTFALDQGDGSGWEMDVPTVDDAVTLMTIHKAKGLDFPVVIVLLYDWRRQGRDYYVEETEAGIRLLKIQSDQQKRVPELERIHAFERLKDEVDELNKLYVALTRAKEEMYVLGVYEKEKREPSRFLPESYAACPKPGVQPKEAESARGLPTMHHNIRRQYEPGARGRLGLLETMRGEFIHAVLSHIEFVDDDLARQLDAAFEKAAPEFDRHFSVKEVRTTVESFLGDTKVRDLFAARDGRSVLVEQEFASASGMLYRMDRVIVDREAVTVIDFKTGGTEMEREYQVQVKNYVTLLREIFAEKRVIGVIAYVDKREVREVA
ncbi:MAG: 3'-5' exonuclease, partial [Bacteroidota bacterium]